MFRHHLFPGHPARVCNHSNVQITLSDETFHIYIKLKITFFTLGARATLFTQVCTHEGARTPSKVTFPFEFVQNIYHSSTR